MGENIAATVSQFFHGIEKLSFCQLLEVLTSLQQFNEFFFHFLKNNTTNTTISLTIQGLEKASLPAVIGTSMETSSSMEALSMPPDYDDINAEQTKKKKRWLGLDLNMQGVFLHVLADCLGSVVVIVSTAIVWQVRYS